MQAIRQLPANIHKHEHGAYRSPPGLLLVPARIALPLIRWPLGYETCAPVRGFLLRLLLLFLTYVIAVAYTPALHGWIWMAAYLAVTFVAEAVAFAQRVMGQQRGEEIHTTEAGWSHLTWRTDLPVWICEQVIVPAAVAALGYALAISVSWELGWWLVLTGASLWAMGRWESAKRWKLTRTTVDGMLQGKQFGQRIEDHERRAYNPLDPTHRKAAQAGKGGVWGQQEPDEAELGRVGPGKPQQRPQGRPEPDYSTAEPPTAATWTDGDGSQPGFLTWTRRRRG